MRSQNQGPHWCHQKPPSNATVCQGNPASQFMPCSVFLEGQETTIQSFLGENKKILLSPVLPAHPAPSKASDLQRFGSHRPQSLMYGSLLPSGGQTTAVQPCPLSQMQTKSPVCPPHPLDPETHTQPLQSVLFPIGCCIWT
jgi:hypothetical protein